MLTRTPRSTRTYTRFPDTTLFRSRGGIEHDEQDVGEQTPRITLHPSVSEAVSRIRRRFHPDPETFIIGDPAMSRTPRPSVDVGVVTRSEEHTSELQSLMRISYAVCSLKQKRSSNKQKTEKKT